MVTVEVVSVWPKALTNCTDQGKRSMARRIRLRGIGAAP